MFTENISDLKMTNLYGQNMLSVTIQYKQKCSNLNYQKAFLSKPKYNINTTECLNSMAIKMAEDYVNMWDSKRSAKYWPRNWCLFIYTNNKQCDNLTWYRLTGCTWVKDRFQCNLWAAVGTNQGIAVAHPNSCWFHRLKCYRIECSLSFSPVIPTFELIRRNLSLNATILLWITVAWLQFICIYLYFWCK